MKKGRYHSKIILIVMALTAFLLFALTRRFSVNVVLSGSMEPALKTGGIVISDTKKRKPDTGDIITYQIGDMNITHRVIGKRNYRYITKGDANDRKDPVMVKPEQITGTVVLDIPFLGHVAVFLRQKSVFCLLALMLIQELILIGIHWKGERRNNCVKKI
nr:signal peptidase I [uncultured Blautia sp.]